MTGAPISHLAKLLGGEVVNAGTVRCPGPGHSSRDDSLVVSFHSDGSFTVHSFAGDGWRVCKDHVAAILGGASMPVFHEKNERSRVDGVTVALRIWDEAVRTHPTLMAYLKVRGLEGMVIPENAIRFHPRCPWGNGVTVPAMIGLLRDIITDEPCGIHRTALKPDGSGKAEFSVGSASKKMLGRAKGGAIKLTADENVHEGIAIAEGIETALSVHYAGVAPMWAVGSAGAISTFPVLAGIEALAIFSDYDDVGLTAARSCGERWVEAGRSVIVARPEHLRTDWNDVVKESRS